MEREQQDKIKNAISHLIPHMDNKCFKENDGKVLINKKVPYFSGKIPPRSGTSYVYEIAKSKIHVKYHDVAIDDMGQPRLLAIYKLKGEKVASMKLVAVKENEPIHDLMMCTDPYAHVFANGSVCWSGYSGFTKDTLPHIAIMFFPTSNSNHGVEGCLKLHKENEGKDFDEYHLEV